MNNLTNWLKWFVGVFGVVIISSIIHISIVTEKVMALETEQEKKIDIVTLYALLETMNTRIENEASFQKQALDMQRRKDEKQGDFNKEVFQCITVLKTTVESMQICDE